MTLDRDRYMSVTMGFGPGEWDSARAWLARRLHRVARDRVTITYGDVCDHMARAGELRLEPHGSPFAWLLGQVNLLEYENGRPLISALVVQKDGGQPGDGFWRFARELGLDPGPTAGARFEFWVNEVNRCYEQWAP